jgi:SAM-dependent methyltransferase
MARGLRGRKPFMKALLSAIGISTQTAREFIPVWRFTPRRWTVDQPLPSKIQYACGLNVLDGWMNVDGFHDALMGHFSKSGVPRRIAGNVFAVDLLDRHPFPDNHFDYAFCEDFIEHIDQKSSLIFLAEVYRTLKPGGILRISTPGFVGVLRRHFWHADRAKIVSEIDGAYDRWGHIHFYSHESLKQVSEALGFTGYSAERFGHSSREALRGLETRPEQEQLNLYAEITK